MKPLLKSALLVLGGVAAGALLPAWRYQLVASSTAETPAVYRLDRLTGRVEVSLFARPWQPIAEKEALPAGWSEVKGTAVPTPPR